MRRSGDAPSKNHERPSSLRASWVCVRGLPWSVPALTALQFVQAQFHCGKAPPAAEPRIFTCISASLTLAIMPEVISQYYGRRDDRDDRPCSFFMIPGGKLQDAAFGNGICSPELLSRIVG